MQNSNPSAQSSFVPFPYCLDPALATAYAEARAARAGAEPSAADIFAALTALGAQTGEPSQPAGSTEPPNPEPGDLDPEGGAEPRFDLNAWLRAFRGPIDWALSVAQLRSEDAVDAAAIDDFAAIERVREAIRRQLAPTDPDAPAKALRLRPSDLLVVIERLFGPIDLALVARAARVFTSGFAEAIAQLLQLSPAIASLLGCVGADPAESHDAHGARFDPGVRTARPPAPMPHVHVYRAPIPVRPAWGPQSRHPYSHFLHSLFR